MSFFIFLTVVQALVAAALVGVILIQKSEGGGLGVGGSPAGFMSARGAADFLTRATTILATAFVVLSIILAALAVRTTAGREIDGSLNRSAPGPVQPASAPADPLAPVQSGPVQGVPAAGPAQTQSVPAQDVPAQTVQVRRVPATSPQAKVQGSAPAQRTPAPTGPAPTGPAPASPPPVSPAPGSSDPLAGAAKQ